MCEMTDTMQLGLNCSSLTPNALLRPLLDLPPYHQLVKPVWSSVILIGALRKLFPLFLIVLGETAILVLQVGKVRL